jgi:ABC-2 type transport system permease protein
VNSRNISYPRRLIEEFKAAFLRDLRSYVRYPAWMIGEFISTPLWFFFFALGVTLFVPVASQASNVSGPSSGMSYFFFGFIFITLFSTSVWGTGQSVRNEQISGTLEQFFLAPANRVTLILGRWARIFLTDSLIISYVTLLLYLLGGTVISLLNPPLFLLSLGLYELSLIGFGLFMAGLTMRIKAYNSVGNIIFFGYMILTGTLFPITVLPTPVRDFSMVIPFTYLNDIMKHAALGTVTILPETLEYPIAIFAAVGMLVFGLVAFNWIERDARVKGSIATS